MANYLIKVDVPVFVSVEADTDENAKAWAVAAVRDTVKLGAQHNNVETPDAEMWSDISRYYTDYAEVVTRD